MAERRPVLVVESYRHRGKTWWSYVCDDHRIIPTFTSEEAARDDLARHLAVKHDTPPEREGTA